MPLNKSCVGRQYPPVATTVTVEALQNYAHAYNDANPHFFDASRPGGIVAPPMFGVVVTWQSVLQPVADPEVGVNPLRLVHGEQDMEFHSPMRPSDVITSTSKIASIDSRSTGETMVIEVNSHNQRHEPVLRTLFTVFIRGAASKTAPPATAEAKPRELNRGEPLVVVSQKIDSDQTFRYAEASGDRNPIHVDENVAKMAGLPGIIVHGLCTMAFTSKVMIDRLCGGDPTRLKRLHVRFSRPVIPGQTITTKVWRGVERGNHQVYDYETYSPEGHAVIRGGIAEVAP
jgi:acyl dehydratase